MKFHHLGLATDDIKKSILTFEKLGFIADDILFDNLQQVNICFLRKSGHPDIELIEPVNEKSPVRNILDKVGTTLYHFCYSTDDMLEEINILKQNNFLLVVKPVAAIAFDSKRVCFCYHKHFGLLELVESND